MPKIQLRLSNNDGQAISLTVSVFPLDSYFFVFGGLVGNFYPFEKTYNKIELNIVLAFLSNTPRFVR